MLNRWNFLKTGFYEGIKRSTHGLQSIDSKVTVLLRSDIFAFVRPLMPEQDKLPVERVVWNDSSLLRQVVEERLLQNAPNHVSEINVWEELFPTVVVGVSPVDFIFRTTLPRPRDVIFMVGTAIRNAVNRQHQSVLPEDLLDARDQYSEFAFRSVLAEDDPERRMLEPVLYEFAGAGRYVTMDEMMERMKLAGLAEDDLEWYINLLCDIGFLGIPTRNGFRYSLEEGERSMLREMSMRVARLTEKVETFEINPAFYQVLQIE